MQAHSGDNELASQNICPPTIPQSKRLLRGWPRQEDYNHGPNGIPEAAVAM